MLNINLKATPYLNLPLRNNHVPPIRHLQIQADLAMDPEALQRTYTVKLACIPAAIQSNVWQHVKLDASGQATLPLNELILDYDFLANLTEAIPGEVIVEVLTSDQQLILKTASDKLRILPPNHWGGSATVPELLAAHVLPNDPATASILHRAATLLAERNLDLSEYQTEEPSKAAAQVVAILTAIRERNLLYASVPGSFERFGQKVRTPSEITSEGIANCLDLSCLAAAALEQAGLHPIIILIERHAYIACWLQRSPHTTGVIDDPQALRKALASHLLLACEATALVGAHANVNEAIDQGAKRLLNPADFNVAIDLHAARIGERITPLNQARHKDAKGDTTDTDTAAEHKSPQLDLSAIANIGDGAIDYDKKEEAILTGSARLDQWKAKLLNLTRRNRLLNYRLTGGAIHLRYVDPATVEDYLATGKQMRFDVVDEQRAQRGQLGRKLEDDHYAEAIQQAVSGGKLLVIGTPEKLNTNLLKLDRAARIALEEGGANTLFVAIGFAVKPKPGHTAEFRPDAPSSERPDYAAPLILLPVNLNRRSAGSAYTLTLRDEEAMLNPTLLEFLKREAGVNLAEYAHELPTDESGLDVNHILNRVRQELLNVAGWEVVDEVALGLFSFSKYLMWRDLDAFESELRRNPVVAHLIDTPREAYFNPLATDNQTFPDATSLDDTFPVTDMLTPMSADSSQLAAVRAAAQGIDFILEGPPGTGKSQTITNLIAQLLGEGKRVLFVSEKTAALDVVQRRLDSIGLGEFCLELHANNATKTAVYDQLRQALNSEASPTSPFAQTATELQHTRSRLNAMVALIHRPDHSGLSVYQTTAYCAPRTTMQVPEPSPAAVAHMDAAWLTEAREQVRMMALYLADVAAEARSVLAPLQVSVDAPAFAKTCRTMIADAATFAAAKTSFAEALKFESNNELNTNEESIEALSQLAQLLQRAEHHDYTDLAEMVDSGRTRRSIATETEATFALASAFYALQGSYRAEINNFDATGTAAEWKKSEQAWILMRWIQQWLMARKVTAFAKTPPQDLGHDLDRLAEIQAQRQHLSEAQSSTLTLEREAIDAAKQRAEFAATLNQFVDQGHAQTLGLTTSKLAAVLDELAEDTPPARALLAAADAFTTASSRSLTSARAYTAARDGQATPSAPAVPLAQLAEQAEAMLRHQRDWRPQGLFAEARQRAEQHELSYFTRHADNGLALGTAPALEGFEVGVRRVLAKAATNNNPELREFSGTAFEDLIARFEQLDNAYLDAATLELRQRLQQRRQNVYRTEFRSALGLLNQELQKKRRQLPVRQLIKQLGGLLPELTPCLLMSPLSIAQYLPADAEQARFDVVVFDEASQIPTWDAIGAIARGKQVVVVGDSKQLPPTSFFGASSGDEDRSYDGDEPVVEDLESILDELKAAQLRSWRLRWHYRSRAESLIAFSNRTYYNGDLNTFPAPVAEDRAVAWHKVDSRDYRQGRNRVEADQLVAYLVERLRKTSPNQLTFGVVTFGQAQQTVIEDMLETARQEYPAIEPHFNPDLDERLFVKNIENVQGDERDVILFSITYGPDESGKVAMRFGPMNQAGGERRLNVAVTRARREMHLFSSMQPEDIDLRRLGENAQGARDLRYFLEFAKRGPAAFAERIEAVGGAQDYDSPFERAVADALRARGYETDPQVGVSGYRIDLGVRDPRRPGHYLAGVECDGATYHATATARERDLLRQSVLEGLGWTILRIWSLDWWHDAERVADNMANKLQRIAAGEVEQPDAEQSPPAAGAAQEELEVQVDETKPYVKIGSEDLADLRQRAADAVPADHTAEALYHPKSKSATVAMLTRIVAAEAPILRKELVRRVATDGYLFGRTGAKIRKLITNLIEQETYSRGVHGEVVVWRDAQQAKEPVEFRPPAAGDPSPRGVADIPLVELVALARTYITQNLDEDQLIRAMGADIGVSSVRGSSRKRVLQAIEVAWAGG